MYKKPLFQNNEKMREYCMKSTNDSIRKMTEKYNEERKTIKHKLNNLVVITNDDAANPNNNNDIILSIVCFLSSTVFFYYFYKVSR